MKTIDKFQHYNQIIKTVKLIFWCLTVIMTAIILFLLVSQSMRWPMLTDVTTFHYMAWRIMEGAVPYRDFFDMNFPGTYFPHIIALKLLGASDLGWRVFDLIWLAAINCLIIAFCKRYGWLSATVAVLLFSLFHIGNGPVYMGNRDYLLILFIAISAYAAFRYAEHSGSTALLAAAGLPLGAAFTVKPTVILLCGLLMLFICMVRLRLGRSWLFHIAIFISSSAVVPLILFGWLWYSGGLFAFIEIITDYLVPIYPRNMPVATLNIYGIYFLGVPVLIEIVTVLLCSVWLLAKKRHADYARILLLIGACYGLLHYIVQGKGLFYHLYPALFFVFLILASWLQLMHADFKFLSFSFLLIILIHFTAGLSMANIKSYLISPRIDWNTPPPPAHYLYADLQQQVSAYDKIQVMEVCGGGNLVLTRLRCIQPTRFIYEMPLLDNPQESYVQKLRAEFLSALNIQQPKLFILMRGGWEFGKAGYERFNNFPEFTEWLNKHYALQKQTEHYRIYARKQN